jgi:hypothetical protein
MMIGFESDGMQLEEEHALMRDRLKIRMGLAMDRPGTPMSVVAID